MTGFGSENRGVACGEPRMRLDERCAVGGLGACDGDA